MDESVNIEAVRAEALRKLGRNIVNFSKIEGVFKYLLAISQLEGNGQTISELLLKNQTRLRKQTLGKLVDEFNKNFSRDASQSEPIPDFSDEEISWSLKVTYDNSDFLKLQNRAFKRIVTERNRLIHQDLARFDTNSIEDCHNLITVLDEQNPRLLAQLEELMRLIENLRKSLKAFKDLSQSPDFLQTFKDWSQSPDFLQSIQSNQSNA
jgi:hypothetical protein